MSKNQIDFTGLDDILAQRALRDWGMNDRELYTLKNLLNQGATKEVIIIRVLEVFPTWHGRIKELEVIIDYIKRNY